MPWAEKWTRVDATPRRLVLRADGLLERQADVEELVLGPAKSAGAGAAAGFAKKMGTTPDQLGTETTAKGEYFAFTKRTQGQPTAAILARELPNLILKIQWPKTMVWNGKGTERFIRPIRWLVALLGDAGRAVRDRRRQVGQHDGGHRVLGKPSIPVTIDNFEQQLTSQRRHSFGRRAARQDRGRHRRRGASSPIPICFTPSSTSPSSLPRFSAASTRSYLDLPQEVLVTVMRHHQKYLSVEDADGKLAPHFIAVMNTNADPDGLVRQGNERVLRARFNDARFFWDQDQKKKLEDRVEDLKNVTFQAKLGSYYDKTQRVVATGEAARRQRARRLALKCDLTTDMVKEFTDLQGIVGGLYAQAQGEPEEVGARDLRSLQAAQHGRRNPVHARRPHPEPRRQMGHAGRMLQGRHDAHRLKRSVRTSPRRPRRGAHHRRRQGEVRLPAAVRRAASSCATASNTTSATSAASPTTKSAPAWPPAGPI